MISGWSDAGKGQNLSKRVMSRVRPEAPLKSRISVAHNSLNGQIQKLAAVAEKLREKEARIFGRIVSASQSNNHAHARMYAGELAEVRKILRIVDNAKLSLEQMQIRLNTVSELGDIVVTLTPCMSVIKSVSGSIGDMVPEANSTAEDFSRVLGEVLSGSQLDDGAASALGRPGLGAGADSPEAAGILDEAQTVIEGRAKASLPDLPESLRDDGPGQASLKHDIVQQLATASRAG